MARRIITGLLVCFSSLACVMGVVQQEAIEPTEPTQHITTSPAELTGTAAPPPPPTWTIYTSGNDVNDMAFDKEGNLWAATGGGLVKWMADGTYIKYTTLDGLPDNDILAVATAPDGTVWLGSFDFDGGLVRFDGKDWTTYTTADGLPSNSVWDVAVAPDGTVWVSTYNSGVTRFDPAASGGAPASEHDGTVTPDRAWTTYTTADGLPGNDAHRIAVTNGGTVWASTASSTVSRLDPAALGGTPASERDGARWSTYTIKDAFIYPRNITAAADGTVWVITSNGLSHFDGAGWQTHTNDGLGYIYAIAVAEDGSVWGTSQHGLFHFAVGAPDEVWTLYPTLETGHSLVLAPDGTVWVAGQGIARFDPTADPGSGGWTTYTTDDELAANRVNHTVKTADGMLWFFTEGGPSCHSGEEWVPCPGIDQGAPIGPSVTQAPDGALWSLHLSSVIRFDPGAAPDSGESWIVYDDFPGSSLGNLTIAPDGSVWVGTYTFPLRAVPRGYGVARFDGTSWQVYTTTHGLADDFVNDIAIAADGAVWFGTANGISRFDGETWTTYDVDTVLPTGDRPYIAAQRVITTPDGLVCCELTGAVSCFDGKSWTTYTEENGLYPEHDSLGIGANFILSTAVDRDGALWVGTNEGGVSRFDGKTWRTYTTADGLAGNQVNTIAVAPDGAVWVGTLNGASRFDGSAWATFTTADGGPSKSNGLADNSVKAIIVDRDGSLWFSTSSGISRYGPPR
jgi:ligand-binding sensor domain-containing protein